MTSASDPVGPDELDGLFARCFPATEEVRAALAVSGGSDSVALMVLFAAWLAQRGRATSHTTVLTVDHGLRAEAALEARQVAGQAATVGFAHAVLAWHGDKPGTGVQAAAREARYRLMAQHMRRHGIACLLTGHTADDQAETMLMRLARGSGLDGLSAMAPVTALVAGDGLPPLCLARPLLAVPKSRLRASLEQRGVPWIEDPSNQSPVFERVRLRAARAQLEALGLTTDMLALSARRLQRARTAITQATQALCASDSVHADPCGFVRIDRAALRAAPEEVAVRLLAGVISAAGGWPEPVPLANVEAMAATCQSDATRGTWTLARALISASPEAILVEREAGRERPPSLAISPGATLLWDGRFLVSAAAGAVGPLEVVPLGEARARALLQAGLAAPKIPSRSLHLLPAFLQGAEVVAVPSLQFWRGEACRGQFSSRFIGLDRYNSLPVPPGGADASDKP